jgi:chromosome segregation ATPase
MDSSGNVHASGTVTQSSDVRLKRDIHPIDGALDAVTGLQGVTYYWKDSEKEQSKQIGLIAQDVEKVFPEVVKTDAEGFKSVAYQNLVAPLISALREVRQWMFEKDDQIQALHREVASVKAESTVKDQKIQKLEKEIEGMKTRLDRIEKSLDQK